MNPVDNIIIITLSYLQAAEVPEVVECKFLVHEAVYEMFDQLVVSSSHDLSSCNVTHSNSLAFTQPSNSSFK